jgi:hemerythrin-like domain-containing protein
LRLLSSPLDYIFAEHFRQRVLFGVLDSIVESREHDIDLIRASLDFLTHDMKFHIQDEEEDLFPCLRKRAEPDDGIEKVIDQLLEEHKSDHIDASEIVDRLRLALSSENISSPFSDFSDSMKRFTANERRHLIVENAIVLPLARVRLTDDDLIQMSLDMAMRRGIELLRNKDD